MSNRRHHEDWLSLVPATGTFLSVQVLIEALPQGLPRLDREVRERLRLAWEEWNESPDSEPIHADWIRFVLREALEFDPGSIREPGQGTDALEVAVSEQDVLLRPDLVIVEPGGEAEDSVRMLANAWEPGTALDEPAPGSAWSASPVERMIRLCRGTGVPLGIVTNGERWALVHAAPESTTSVGTWYAELWFQETRTLEAFASLLGARRLFGVPEDRTLEALLEKSSEYQEEVTDQLGRQVRTAVEVLIQALDKADADLGGTLLEGIPEQALYEASITVMMRLVFLFHAEERGLLSLGDPVWDEFYAVSLLRDQLRSEADRLGLEVLERRKDAWLRLLAVFRVVYGGARHEELSLPAYGGSLFDPDRFPFLEGRTESASWKKIAAEPLPIDNRTVLHLLESLQLLGGRKLSFEALDIEQIGHVYEGLLDHVAVRVEGATLGLKGTQDKEPEVALSRMEETLADGRAEFVDLIVSESGRSGSAIENALEREPDAEVTRKLLVACGNDRALLERVLPFHDLIRDDVWGYPVVYGAGSVMVTGGPDRRETGTHYTPVLITQEMVEETLRPLVYDGLAEGTPTEEWELKSPEEILALRVCDPAMGSGAFLVQACRWLAERLAESWAKHETRYQPDSTDPLPEAGEERLVFARRIIAERCLYGVDTNALAVELAKLSIWLVTLAKGRPFGFLDHAFRRGDSLIGVHDPAQLEHFHVAPERGVELHATLWDYTARIAPAMREAAVLRNELGTLRVIDVRDVRRQQALEAKARAAVARVHLLADALFAAVLARAEDSDTALDELLVGLAPLVDEFLEAESSTKSEEALRSRVEELLASVDHPEGKRPDPFHWPVAFPEVFEGERSGFDGILGNPPYMGGQKITGNLGKPYREVLVRWIARGTRGSADLVAYFFLRAYDLLRTGGNFGLLAVNTIAEGDTRQVGLEPLVERGAEIYSSHPNEPWPNRAAVVTSRVHVHEGAWGGDKLLSGEAVSNISAFLSSGIDWSPERLRANQDLSFIGSYVLGMGFVLEEEEALAMIERDPRNRDVLYPYLTGRDLNSDPEQKPSRWVINFWDWPIERAREYEEPFAIVESEVKAERQEKRRKSLRDNWWIHAEKRPALYHAIGRGHLFEKHPETWSDDTQPLPHVIVKTLVSRTDAFALVPNDQIYAHKLAVFASCDFGLLAILNSSFHQGWAWRFSSTMKNDLNYSPSDCVETFPLPRRPSSEWAKLEEAGREFSGARREVMVGRDLGLTDLYNSLHDETIVESEILWLRRLYEEIDAAVAKAYGWEEIELGHGFHEARYLPEPGTIRYGIRNEARREILNRLLELNKERFSRESRSSGPCDPGRSPKLVRSAGQDSLFDVTEDVQTEKLVAERPQSDPNPARAILGWLRARDGWYARGDVLEALDLSVSDWNAGIAQLVEEGSVERKGQRRGTKYRAVTGGSGFPSDSDGDR